MSELRIIPPSRLGIRGDDGPPYGSGAFGARRERATAGADEFVVDHYQHKGTDFIVEPGDVVPAPAAVVVTLHSLAYADDLRYASIHMEWLEDASWQMKLLYAFPVGPVGVRLKAGEPLAVAQDIALRYPGITRHVHLEVRHLGILIDPTTLLEEAA